MPNLVKKVQNTIFQNQLFNRGAKIILAVSGGPDSVCLLDIFSKLKNKYALRLILAHVNYGLRGKDSERDEKFVRKLSERYGLKIFVYHLQKNKKSPSENELRNIRYAFFERIRKKNNFDLIAVAHNADDQVETFFMRLLRGSGLAGLAAMRYKNDRVIRPLLGTWKDEITDYLKRNHLACRIDKTNLRNDFARNKIRNQLIPNLEKNFNPAIKKTIFDSIESIAQDITFLNETSQKAHGTKQPLSVKMLLKLHPAIQKRVLLEAIRTIRPDLKDIESAHVREVLKALKSTKGKRQIVIFKGLKMTRRGDKLNIYKV
jgi:tRNA(Ile)-lysidine synthase